MKMSLAICALALLLTWPAFAAPPPPADFIVPETNGVSVRVSCKAETITYLKRDKSGKAQVLFPQFIRLEYRHTGMQAVLTLAILRGDVTLVRALIARDLQVLQPAGDIGPLFFLGMAVKTHADPKCPAPFDPAGVIDALCDAGITVTPQALHGAAQSGMVIHARALLAHGALVNALDDKGDTPYYVALCNGNNAVADFLKTQGGKIFLDESPLYSATAVGDVAEVKRLLEMTPAEVNRKDAYGHTPLLIAVACDQRAVAALLLERGADVQVAGKDSLTPLHLAVQRRDTALMQLLFDHGAKADVAGLRPMDTPLFRVIYDITVYAKGLPEREKNVLDLLLRHGADVNGGDLAQRTALHSAVASGNVPLTKYLLAHGAKVNAITKDGYTVLDVCRDPQISLELITKYNARYSTHNSDELLAIGVTPDGHLLVTIIANYTVRGYSMPAVIPEKSCCTCIVRNLATGAVERRFTMPNADPVTLGHNSDLAFLPDGYSFLQALRGGIQLNVKTGLQELPGGMLQQVNVKTGIVKPSSKTKFETELWPIAGSTNAWTYEIQFQPSKNGKRPMLLKDCITGRILRQVSVPIFTWAAVSRDGTLAMTCNGTTIPDELNEHTIVRFVDLSSGKECAHTPLIAGFTNINLQISRDTRTAAVITEGGPLEKVTLWDTTTGRQLRCFTPETDYRLGAFCFSLNGELLAYSQRQLEAGETHYLVTLRDVKTGAMRRQYQVAGNVTRMCFTPDGTRLITTTNGIGESATLGPTQVWDTCSNACLAYYPADEVVK